MEFLSSNGTQKGWLDIIGAQLRSKRAPILILFPILFPINNSETKIRLAFPLALNFIASGECFYAHR